MRLPYIPDPPQFADPTSQIIVDQIRDRRIKGGHNGLVELDKTLLYSPAVASGWNSFLGAIRTQTSLNDHVRELVICRVAALNEAAYEWKHHAPLLSEAIRADENVFVKNTGTLTIDAAVTHVLDIVRAKDVVMLGQIECLARSFVHLAEAVSNFVDASTKQIRVDDKIWKDMRSACREGPEGDKEVVEITATCAAYNCVSRFLVALDVGEATW